MARENSMNVVFDFGAVLFTWQPAQLLAQCFPAEAATPQEAGQLAHAVFGHPDWQHFDRGTLAMSTVVDRTAERLRLDHATLLDLVQSIGAQLQPMADSVALLGQLRALGTPLYFLSNMPEPYARTLEQRHAFLQWFDGGIFSGDVNHIKPEADIYTLLQTRYALNPAHTVFIDDLKTNVAAAQAHGWHGIHFESASQLRADLLGLNIG